MKSNLGWVVAGYVLVAGSSTFVTLAADEVRPPSPPPIPAPATLPPTRTAVVPPSTADVPRPPSLNPFPSVAPSSTVSVRPTVPTIGQPGPIQVSPVPGSVPQIPGYPPGGIPAPAPAVSPAKLTALKWDAESKEYTSKPGEMNAMFTFWLTNTSSSEVSITSVRTSCGCTVAKLPATPWVVPPGQGGPIDVTVNLAGKSGLITKAVTVESPAGTMHLTVKVNIGGAAATPTLVANNRPTMNDADRLKNMQMTLGDRQVVFKKRECAECHADPAKGHTDGRQLYSAVCGVCHDSHIRASMVPDLKALAHATDADYWRNWITYGRAGSMMPAFAQAEGGPLSDAQINALVNYMVQAYPTRPPGAYPKSAALGPVNGAPAGSAVSPVVSVPGH